MYSVSGRTAHASAGLPSRRKSTADVLPRGEKIGRFVSLLGRISEFPIRGRKTYPSAPQGQDYVFHVVSIISSGPLCARVLQTIPHKSEVNWSSPPASRARLLLLVVFVRSIRFFSGRCPIPAADKPARFMCNCPKSTKQPARTRKNAI